MKEPVIIIGMGEMGGVFARGFLRSGHPVFPVTRDMDISSEASRLPEPALVLVSVAENDLRDVLAKIPSFWTDRLVLLQNELLPGDWEAMQLNPTVISVWFEKKKGQDAKVIIPSPVFGPHAGTIARALESIDIPVRILNNSDELLAELVLKNLYILTTNICGLKVGGTVGELWQQHETLARNVASEVLSIQCWLTGQTFDLGSMLDSMLVAFKGDLEHKCMGRSAPARLKRAMGLAQEAGLNVPTLSEIHHL
jgi:hypothetical protein